MVTVKWATPNHRLCSIEASPAPKCLDTTPRAPKPLPKAQVPPMLRSRTKEEILPNKPDEGEYVIPDDPNDSSLNLGEQSQCWFKNKTNKRTGRRLNQGKCNSKSKWLECFCLNQLSWMMSSGEPWNNGEKTSMFRLMRKSPPMKQNWMEKQQSNTARWTTEKPTAWSRDWCNLTSITLNFYLQLRDHNVHGENG